MPNIGPGEIILIAVVVLLLFGAKKLPEIGKSIGKGINEFKKGIRSGDADADAPARQEKSKKKKVKKKKSKKKKKR